MRISQIKQVLKKMYIAPKKRSVFLWGPPGIGKSSIIFQVADELNQEFGYTLPEEMYQVADIRLIHYDPVDLRGVPKVDEASGFTKWFPPDFLPRSGRGFLFLDELNTAPRAVQSIGYQLILDRRIADYHVPPGWMIIGAGNRETDAAFVQPMASPLCNRFMFHIDVDVDAEEWIYWANNNNLNPMVIAYIKFSQDSLMKFDPKQHQKAFPTPRTWEFMSDAMELRFGDNEGILELFKSCIGAGEAVKFISFIALHKQIPRIEDILKSPDTAPLPTNPSVGFTLCVTLARMANFDNMNNIKKYVERLGREYSALTISLIAKTKATEHLAETPAFCEWAVEYGSILI
jgi:hypothetical protein